MLKFTCLLSYKVLHPLKLNHHMGNAAETSACSTLPSAPSAVHRLYVPSITTLKLHSMASTMTAGTYMLQEIASMAFSPDGRLLAAQGGSPEWNLVLWVWEKSKVVTSVKTTNAAGNPVYQVRTGFTGTIPE